MVCCAPVTITTMVEFKDRLKMAMEHANVGRDALRKHLNVTRVAIDKQLDGRSKSMSAEHCAHAAHFLGVNAFWLATGLGEMILQPTNEVRDSSRADHYLVAAKKHWPMETVSLAEYLTLTERQQGHIEGQIRALLHVKSSSGRQAA